MKKLVVLILLLSCVAQFSWSEATTTPPRQRPPCKADARPWDCYRELRVAIDFIDLQADGRRKTVPAFSYVVQHFFNGEMLVEEASFSESRKKTYLFAMPSEKKILDGWQPHEDPLARVMEAQSSVIDILTAAFPDGPESMGEGKQIAVVKVTRYVFPIGEREAQIKVQGWKSANGKVQIEFDDFGEPIGPYQVSAVWGRAPLAALPDDYSIVQTEWTNFGTEEIRSRRHNVRLGDVRRAAE